MHAANAGNNSTLSLPDSLWAKTACAPPHTVALSGQEEADVVIVGAGYTGLSAALHLAEAGLSVRVLDAGEPGWGCSGRNGGQVNPGGMRARPEQMLARLGHDRGARMIAAAHASTDLVFELIARFDIDCDAVRPGYVQGGYGRTGRNAALDWARAWEPYGVEVQRLDRAGLADLLGSDGYEYGFYDPRGGNLQPLSYARGLAHAAIASGATIHRDSTALKLEKQGAGWRVTTLAGNVSAPRVILATNGYTDNLWPRLRQSIVPTCSYLIATAPLSANVLATVLPGRHAVSESSNVISYYRVDGAGRLIFGGRGNAFDMRDGGSPQHLKDRALELFPALEGVTWEYQWSGYPAITRDGLPKLIHLQDGVLAGLGYNGRGVGMATMMGKQLALATQNERGDIDPEPLATFALHPLRQIGISARLLSGEWQNWWHRRAYRAERAADNRR